MLVSKILIVSGATIRVIFQNSVTYVKTIIMAAICQGAAIVHARVSLITVVKQGDVTQALAVGQSVTAVKL